MRNLLCVIAIAITGMAAVGPAEGGGRRRAKDLSRCVPGGVGRVDMACLGGKSKGWSQLEVHSHGDRGMIPGGTRTMFSVLPAVRDCHEAAIGRAVSGVDGAFAAWIDVDARGRARPPEVKLDRLWDRPLIDCVTRSLAALRFRPPRTSDEGQSKITISMIVVGGPGSRITRTLTDDAHAMCAAARTILEEAEDRGARRLGMRYELEKQFARSMPSEAGAKIIQRLAFLDSAKEVPAAWRKALVDGGVAPADAACAELDTVLVGRR